MKRILLLVLSFLLVSCAGRHTDSSSYKAMNVAYGKHPDEIMDIYLPKGDGPFPVMVMIHGGAWYWGDKRENNQSIKWLVETGYAVFNINYRLGDESRYYSLDEKLADIGLALDFIDSHGEEWNLGETLTLYGFSAGAHLGLQYGFTRGKGTVDAVISYSGPTDLLNPGYRANGVIKWIDALFPGLSETEMEEAKRQGSPLYIAESNGPAVLLVHGTADATVPYDDSLRLKEKLEAVGGEVLLIAIEGVDHDYKGTDWDAVGPQTWEWMEKHCRKIA